MKFHNFIYSTLALILLFATGASTLQLRDVTHKSYAQWQKVMRDVEGTSTSIHAELLSLQAGYTRNHDRLAELTKDAHIEQRVLSSLSNQDSSLHKPYLGVDAGELAQLLSDQVELVYDFQTELSALRSSEKVFLISLERIMAELQHSNNIELLTDLFRLELQLMQMAETSFSANDIQRIAAETAKIEAAHGETLEDYSQIWFAIRSGAVVIAMHARNLDDIIQKETVLEAAQKAEIAALFPRIQTAYKKSQIPEIVTASILLLELGLLVVVFLFKSRSLSKKLQHHNEELEGMIAVRTECLELALKDLQESSDEKVKMEEELRIAQRLEAIGQLAAGIAHEINTPVQFVSDNLRFLQEAHEDLYGLRNTYNEALQKACKAIGDNEQLDGMADYEEEIDLEFLMEEVPQALDNALDGASRISKIVKSMKDFSHPGSEGCQNVDLNKALDTTLNVARNEWKYVAEVEQDFEDGLPAVPLFASEFNQVLLNIIVNAAHAIEQKQKDSAVDELGKIYISTRMNGDYISLRIRDTGCGIPQENIDRVFDPFFTTKEVGKGTGQGLSIAHKIVVDKHKGKLEVKSSIGEFTEFHIQIPRESNVRAEQEEILAEAS